MKTSLKLLIGFCFLISGVTSLVLEVVWNKELSYIFGISLHSTAVVVAAYMFGLALGAMLISQVKYKIANPIKFYSLLQIGVGGFGIISIPFFRAFKPVFSSINVWQGTSVFFFIIKFLVLFVAMAIPVTLMGMTLPLMTAALDRFKRGTAENAGVMYGVNTLGAVLGCLIGGFVLIPNFGLQSTAIIAGTTDFLLGLFLILCQKYFFANAKGFEANQKHESPKKDKSGHQKEEQFTPGEKIIPYLFASSGFFAMTYEVAWFRYLANVFGATVHAFSMMLAIFLVGIGLGSVVGSRLVGRFKSSLTVFSIIEIVMGILTLYTVGFYNSVPIWYGRLFQSVGLFQAQVGVSAFVVLPATLCMGALFPVVIKVMATSQEQDSHRTVGRAYAANTLGSIFGSILAGFIIIPQLGYLRAIELACVGNMLIGLAAVFKNNFLLQNRKIKVAMGTTMAALVLLFLIPAPDLLLLNQGISMVMRNPEKFNDVADGKQNEFQSLLYHRDGINESIAVIGNEAKDGSVGFRVSSKNEASTSLLGRRHLVLLGQLPLLFSRNQDRVAVLGYGAGITAGSVLTHPGVKQMDILELEPAVIAATKYFNTVNGVPLADPRTKLHYEDGRIFLDYTRDKFDVITTDPVSPWLAGSSNLYSLNFYKLMSERLQPGGVFCQWVQMGDFSEEVYKTILNSVRKSFAHLAIFISTYDTVLIASNDPISIPYEIFEKRFNVEQVRSQFKEDEINSAEEVMAFYFAGTEQIERYLEGHKRLNTDDNVWMETHLPFELYSFSAGNFGADALNALIPGRLSSILKVIPGVTLKSAATALAQNPPREFPTVSQMIADDIKTTLRTQNEKSLTAKIDEWTDVKDRELEQKEHYLSLLSAVDSAVERKAFDDAEKYYREILAHNGLRGFYPYGIKFIKFLIDRNKLGKALEIAHLLEKNMPAFPAAYVSEVQILRALGKDSEARAAVERGLLFNPDNRDLQKL